MVATTTTAPGAGTAIFRPLGEHEFEEIYDLLEVAFSGGWPRKPIQVHPLEHLVWKNSSPLTDPADREILELDGRIAAFGSRIDRELWIHGETHRGRSGGDLAIHPDYQGRGLIQFLTDYVERRDAERGAPKAINVSEGSTHPRLLRRQRRLGDRVFLANRFEKLTYHLSRPGLRHPDSGRLSWRPALSAVVTNARIAANLPRRMRPPRLAAGLSVRPFERFDSRADELWETARTDFDYAVVKDRRYLDWRYADPRAGIYTLLEANRGSGLAGYVVLTRVDGDAQLLDILVRPGDIAALSALIAASIEEVRTHGGRGLTVLLPRVHPYRRTVRRFGFIPTKRVDNMGFGARDDRLLDFLETDRNARIHLNFGDSDHV